MTISNPCYHCYMGAIGECLRCPISYKPWSEDLEHETIEIDDDIDDDIDDETFLNDESEV